VEAKPEGLSGQSNHKPRLETFVDKYNVLMSSIASIFLMGFITVVMIQVISRTFLPKSPAWTEEVARYFFIYMVAFGASVAVHKKEFVGIDLLTVYFPDTINRLLEILINAGLLTLCWFLLLRSVLKFALIKYRMVSTA
jgi:TRAP-type C4-dicarboxylate transport system permease small subunit